MRSLLILPVLLLALFVGNSASSADFQIGLDAHKSGDFATALREFRPLAEHGNAFAQTSLGMMYYNGQGVPQNYETAVKWFTLGADQGIAGAQFSLGRMYEIGKGVPQNYETTVKWSTLAAEQGDDLTQTLLVGRLIPGFEDRPNKRRPKAQE